MRSALMRSNDEDPYGQEDRCAGEQAMSYRFCTSVPRFAGEWLARHCDAETVSMVREYMTDEQAQELLGDTFPAGFSASFDGSLRVMARCDPERWNELFAAYPRRDALGSHHQPAQ